MYICNKCGAVVDTVPRERVKHSELDFPVYVYEDDDCDCGGEFDEACCCKACGEYADENEMVNGFCKGCVLILKERFETLMNQFTPEERETINVVKDGERL